MIFFKKRKPESHILYPTLQKISEQQHDLVVALQSLTQAVETLATRHTEIADINTKTVDEAQLPQQIDESSNNFAVFQIPDSVNETIELCDWILLARAEAIDDVKLILERILSRLRIILESNNITVLEEKGLFDSSLHKVVHVRPTDDPSLDNNIAEVVRPGYTMNGRMIRSQEVVIYHKTQK